MNVFDINFFIGESPCINVSNATRVAIQSDQDTILIADIVDGDWVRVSGRTLDGAQSDSDYFKISDGNMILTDDFTKLITPLSGNYGVFNGTSPRRVSYYGRFTLQAIMVDGDFEIESAVELRKAIMDVIQNNGVMEYTLPDGREEKFSSLNSMLLALKVLENRILLKKTGGNFMIGRAYN